MTDTIEAILFDMGGTLRGSIANSEEKKQETVQRIIDLLGADASPDQFTKLLSARAKAYSKWARETSIELNEKKLWTQWMLPDWPADRIGELAIQLNQLWREATGVREIFPETKEVVLDLFRRGYRLGIVSNTVSSVEVPRALKELEITGCFETVILSCNVGMRKPGPAILLEATRQMGIEPEKCVYIGDRLNRDVESSRKAGFAKAIILRAPTTFADHQRKYPDLIADHYVDNLKELLEIFPARQKKRNLKPVFNASLSTMWVRKNFPTLTDFFEAAGRLGFARVELNHQIDSALLNSIDLKGYKFSSVHEPCPADVSTEQLKERDWLISSSDEDCRVHGVEAIKRSIDFAHKLSVPIIVVHCGMVSTDMTLEKNLRLLYEAGRTDMDEYRGIKQQLIESRARLIGPRFEAVKKSLLELLEYAGRFRIRLGLENRYHYFDIPNPDEMGKLLALAGPDRLGFVYDVGHAQALDQMGFFAHEEWPRRYSSRIIEVHLHDVKGIADHFAPGLGEVDFDMVASYLPDDAIRTIEIQVVNTPEQVKAGLKFLTEHRCINTV